MPGAPEFDLSKALLDVRQMREADALAVAAGISGIALMENAGASVAREIVRRWSIRPVAVLCGPGNNGGDGFVVARHLSRAGWPVRLALLGRREHLAGEARHHAELWTGSVEVLAPPVLDGSRLVVDALFGAGLSRALEGAAAAVLAAAADRLVPIVAIDVPSGIMGDSGDALGAVAATLTVTFFRKKPGHLLMPGRSLCGEVVVTEIGTPASVLDTIAPDTFENDPSLWRSALLRPTEGGNKYTRGHAVIWGGYPMTGAARMAARAAARAGAGLTTIAVAEVALSIYATASTSIMVRPIATPGAFDDLLRDQRLTGLAIGPGAGIGAETRNRALAMLATRRPTVLDADAITSFGDDPEALFRAITGPCVITPHEGEFRRLFDATGDKLKRAREAACRSGAIIVLKGADTVIASPAGLAVINANAPATLATAGSGDVLSGIILGLLAQGVAPFHAACAGVWLHGAAAADFGPGLIAEDLPDLLPGVLRRL
jgi:NAD(P)H-hydrate epimerase